jgi:hypothetical protein
MEPTRKPEPKSGDAGARPAPSEAASPAVRWAATLVLIPAVPLLVGSVAALALFYAAPTRFSRVLAQLPGEDVLRTILFFAPVTLFAIVVLAALYALEKPGAVAAAPAPASAGRPSLAAGPLLITAPLLLIAVTAWVARFLAPGRFAALLDPFPGTSLLQTLVTLSPPVLMLVNVAVLIGAGGGRSRRTLQAASATPPATRWARRVAGLLLVPTLPLLLASIVALALYSFSPERLESLLTQLSQATVVRLGLLFGPAALTAIVFLASLYLLSSTRPAPMAADAAPDAPAAPAPSGETRQHLAVGVLVTGLAVTALIALGLIGALVWLLLR